MSLVIEHLFRFEEFTIDKNQRVLLRDGKPLPLTPKVFDTLLMLVENHGRIVVKDELMNRLWPESFVGEANLTFNIQQLRKSLGDNARNPRYIETVSRRGYRFIARVDEVSAEPAAGRVESRALGPVVPLDRASLVSPLSAGRALQRRTLLVVVIGVLCLLALLGWKLSTKRPAGAATKSVPNAPTLKIDKLTQTGESRLVAVSPDGKYLAYTRTKYQKTGIWLRQLDNEANVELVPATAPIAGLAFSRNGDALYFVRVEATSVLYSVSLVLRTPVRILDHLEGKFAISFDDRHIAFVRQRINQDGEREFSLIVAASDGSNERTLLVSTHPDDLNAPVWTPDDAAIICAYGNSDGGGQKVRLVSISLADGLKRDLSPEAFYNITKVAWLRDNSGLVMSARKQGEINQLWTVSYPGMAIRQLTDDSVSYGDLSLAAKSDLAIATQVTRFSDMWTGAARQPQSLKKITSAIGEFSWGPSGRIIYTSTISGKRDLWTMQPNGMDQRQITADGSGNGVPAATADNNYVVFVSNRSGLAQIWRMDSDGANQTELTSGLGKYYPAISPDGSWVIYNTTDDWHLWRVSINGGETKALTDYVASHAAISPNGKMIACFTRSGLKGELLIIPYQGGPPLRRFTVKGSVRRIQWTPDNTALFYALDDAILKQSLTGGLPAEIVRFEDDELFDFGFSPDGQSLAVTRGGWEHDVVSIAGLNH